MNFETAMRYKERGIVTKLKSYPREYDKYLAPYKNSTIRMLEIGVSKGGSLYAWKNFFPNAKLIVGIDVKDECKKFEDSKIRVEIGSQDDRSFLLNLNDKYGPFDVILDDGSHVLKHQRTSFEVLFPLLKEGGMYIIEDLHTSYWPRWGGSMIEYLKKTNR